MALLHAAAEPETLEGLARVGITATNPLGVPMGKIQKIAKTLGRSHSLAAALWATKIQDARLLAAFVENPAEVTASQMDRWTRDFDNWALCDTLCMHLYDRTPHAWTKVTEWAGRPEEFVKRAGFALLASLASHDKFSSDARFHSFLPLIKQTATDERNYVKKAVSWALRHIGQRNASLRAAAIALSKSLAASPDSTARWIGRDALRDLEKSKSRKDKTKA